MRTIMLAAVRFYRFKTLLFGLLLLVTTTGALAQEKTVSGHVKNETEGTPIGGATVQVKGTGHVTATDEKGAFSIKASSGQTLVVSAIGFTTAEKVVGNQAVVNFDLTASSKEMEGLVVTALGISRQQKALGYSAQQVSGEELTDARSNNWSSALSGKVAGLQMTSAGSGPVNSTRITLRGDISLNPNNNNALIVVDGVPMNNRNMTSSGMNDAYGAGSGSDVPVDFGNGIQDINPDDIESITVLKGPGATALYGSRAGNGAILITTKSGRKGKGLGVTLNSNLSFNTVLRWPDYQYEYGQGAGNNYLSSGEKYYDYDPQNVDPSLANTGSTSSAYGPKFNGQMYYQYDPTVQGRGAQPTLWRPYEDNIKGFWRTGSTITNSVSLDGGNDKGSVRMSLTHSKNEWIMPNTGFERITAQTSLNYKFSDKLKASAKVSYTNKSSDNLPATGYNNQSIAYFMIFQNPSIDLKWYEDRWKKGAEQVDQIHPFSSFIDNPYLIAYEMTNSTNSHSLVGTISGTYEFSKKFDLMLRSSVNSLTDDRQMRRPFSTANFREGYYKEQAITDYEINSDFLFSYHDKLASDFDVRASVGANKMAHRYNRVDAYVDGLVIPGVYMLANGKAIPLTQVTDKNYNVNSVYGLAAFSYKNKYFIDFTARNDWSSTLPRSNWSFFYPSVNTSFVLSDIFTLPRAISFAKLRFSAAQAGNDTDPYQTSLYYGISEFPSSASINTTLYNGNLTPEISTNFEGGLDMRFLRNRIGLDVTVYNNTTKNQIVRVPLDRTTGYTYAILNSGKVRNRGVELVLNSKNISGRNFTWSTTINWAKNDNKVLELAKEFESAGQQDIGYGGNATIQARVGGTTGDIYGFGFVRTPDGQIIYNSNGLPKRPTEIQFIGKAFADWKGGIQNEFSYKGFKFSFLLDGQHGGKIYSQTHHKMTEQGKLKHTLRGRDVDYIIGEGVVEDGNGGYKANTKQVKPEAFYADYYRRANVEANTFDASFLKLREARLEYSIPKHVLGKTFINQATFAIYGRDLLMWTDFPVFDPETAALNGNVLLPGVEMGQLPSTRTMGVNLTLKF
ncbi:MAG: SusC/RagA family TonB-linked outer membrane protein [Flavisolibacter sp.]